MNKIRAVGIACHNMAAAIVIPRVVVSIFVFAAVLFSGPRLSVLGLGVEDQVATDLDFLSALTTPSVTTIRLIADIVLGSSVSLLGYTSQNLYHIDRNVTITGPEDSKGWLPTLDLNYARYFSLCTSPIIRGSPIPPPVQKPCCPVCSH